MKVIHIFDLMIYFFAIILTDFVSTLMTTLHKSLFVYFAYGRRCLSFCDFLFAIVPPPIQ